MNANLRFEIVAKAYELCTGALAPGKDSALAAGHVEGDVQESLSKWSQWRNSNRQVIDAMIKAFEELTE